MRKFKFMSKAVVGMMAVAMTMGSLSGVTFRQPVAVYAAISSITVAELVNEGEEPIPQEPGANFTLGATLDGMLAADEKLTWVSSDEDVATVTVDEDSTIATVEITESAEKDATATITVYYKKDDPSDEKSATFDITVVEKTVDDNNNFGESNVDAWIDVKPMTLTVKTSDAYFTVEVLKTASKTEKASKTYVYARNTQEGKNVIDLGFLKIKKGSFLNVYGANSSREKGKVITIGEQPKKEKITVETKESSFAAAIGKKDKGYEYRSSLGSDWKDVDLTVEQGGLDFKSAQVAGTTVIVREKAKETTTDGSTKYTPAGPEIKVKIPAAPKAPKVTIDYSKEKEVKVTDKMKIALLEGSTPPADGDLWKQAGKGMSRDDIAKLLLGEAKKDEWYKKFTIVVRTEGANNKPNSMPAVVVIKEQPVLAHTDEKKTEVKSGAATLKAEKDDTGAVTFTAANGDFQYEVSGKWKDVTSKPVKNLGDTVKVRLKWEKTEKGKADSGAFHSNKLELTVTKKGNSDDSNGGGETSKFDKITIAASTEEGYTAPTTAELVAGITSKALEFKYTAKATKGESEDAVEGVEIAWKVTAPEGSTADMSGWTWEQATGTLTIAQSTQLVAGTYKVTAESGTVKSENELTIVIIE